MADFIYADQQSLTITTNKVALLSDLSTIGNYIKNIDTSQLKSYLKILGISYLIENTNISITSNIAEKIIKSTHIFNDIVLTSKPRVIKVLPKSDIAVV